MRYGILGLAAVAMLASTGASAVVIKPDTATASTVFNSSYAAERTIDGSGLTDPLDVTLAHATYTSTSNHWTTARSTNPLNQWIEWGFDAPQSIGAAYIWNHRSDGVASNSGYEPTLFDLTFYDSTDNVLQTFNDLDLAPDNAFAQRFDFALISNVSKIRFDIEAVQSTTSFTGLAEVAFDTTSKVTDVIPEPATWAMLIVGFGLIGSAMRRRRPATAAIA